MKESGKKLSDREWRERLSEQEYKVLRERGTEPPFTGQFNDFKEDGLYRCRACGHFLFRSDTKYNPGCGWPSFWDVGDVGSIERKLDLSHGMAREEVLCKGCGSHLGHVFPDGPEPTHQRFCINSVCLSFEPKGDHS